MAATGVIWGSAVFLLLSGAGSTQDEFLLFMLAGLTTGTIASSASYVPAACAFIIPILFPVSLHYMLSGPRIELAMGLVILFAMGVIIRLAISAQATIIKAMRLRHRNAALVSSLETRQGQLESKSAFLQAVLDNIRQGVSVFDKDLKLTAWNQAFLDIPQPPEERIKLGRSLEELTRLKAARGEYGSGDTEETVVRRMAEVNKSVTIAKPCLRTNLAGWAGSRGSWWGHGRRRVGDHLFRHYREKAGAEGNPLYCPPRFPDRSAKSHPV